jgi:hypothetical protein
MIMATSMLSTPRPLARHLADYILDPTIPPMTMDVSLEEEVRIRTTIAETIDSVSQYAPDATDRNLISSLLFAEFVARGL